MSTIVDTAALAAHLGCTPAHVRRLARTGKIPVLGRKVLGKTGRPSMWFDIEAIDKALDTRRARLDAGQLDVRKS